MARIEPRNYMLQILFVKLNIYLRFLKLPFDKVSLGTGNTYLDLYKYS